MKERRPRRYHLLLYWTYNYQRKPIQLSLNIWEHRPTTLPTSCHRCSWRINRRFCQKISFDVGPRSLSKPQRIFHERSCPRWLSRQVKRKRLPPRSGLTVMTGWPLTPVIFSVSHFTTFLPSNHFGTFGIVFISSYKQKYPINSQLSTQSMPHIYF